MCLLTGPGAPTAERLWLSPNCRGLCVACPRPCHVTRQAGYKDTQVDHSFGCPRVPGVFKVLGAGDGPQTLLPAQATPSVWERGDLVVPQGSLISACSWRHPPRVLRRPPTRQLGSPSPTLGGPRRPPGLDRPGGAGNCGHPSVTRACCEYPRSVHLARALHWIFPRVTRACDSVSQLEQKTPQPTPLLSLPLSFYLFLLLEQRCLKGPPGLVPHFSPPTLPGTAWTSPPPALLKVTVTSVL